MYSYFQHVVIRFAEILTDFKISSYYKYSGFKVWLIFYWIQNYTLSSSRFEISAVSTYRDWTVLIVCFVFSIDIHEQLPVQRVVATETILSEDDIDPDVLASMNSLGCFHDKGRLIEKLLREE